MTQRGADGRSDRPAIPDWRHSGRCSKFSRANQFQRSDRPARAGLRLAVASALFAGSAVVAADPPSRSSVPTPAAEAAQIERLIVLPPQITLGGANRRQQVLVTAITSGGRERDVTAEATFELTDPKLVQVAEACVSGITDGETTLVVSFGSRHVRIPVQVLGFDSFPPVHFANDIIPLFTKLGCNGGGCHGKASGQNGFKLSVFGFDPAGDYEALVNEARGRRVFPADPDRSLVLLKATGRVPHGGGRRIAPGSDDETLLREWLRQAAPRGAEDAPRLSELHVEPRDRVLAPGSEQQLLATAVYSDGSFRDVTAAALYTSNAPTVADVAAPGRIEIGRIPGEAAITVNYMGQVAAVQFQVPRTGSPLSVPLPAASGPIDELVWRKLDKMGLRPSPPTDDATFLRRASLDTIGLLPTAEEARQFLADRRADKRRRLIEKLLARPELADLWALKWADILLADRNKLGDRGAYEFHRWLRDNFARNRPYDEWVRELISATGHSARNGPVNFFRSQRAPEELARSISQAFLGIRLDCAQCHHHPFDRWGQEDFYGLAGYFHGLTFQPVGTDAGRELVFHAGHRETRMPLTDLVVPTRPPGGPAPPRLERGDPRAHLAEWITAPDNPYFARLVANRLWKHFLGRGLIEPEDDLRSTNPATNEPLLAFLAQELVARRFDLRSLMRLILESQTYQLSSAPDEGNADDEQNFSHFTVRRLPAEILMDAISRVTEVPEDFPGLPQGTRAVELWDNRFPSYFLEIFGRPERSTPCECGRSNEPTLSQALHLMNAPEVDAKIRNPRGRVARLLAAGASPQAIAEELCLAALGRSPNAQERRTAEALFAEAPPREAAEDFLWALLNSYDFLFVK